MLQISAANANTLIKTKKTVIKDRTLTKKLKIDHNDLLNLSGGAGLSKNKKVRFKNKKVKKLGDSSKKSQVYKNLNLNFLQNKSNVSAIDEI